MHVFRKIESYRLVIMIETDELPHAEDRGIVSGTPEMSVRLNVDDVAGSTYWRVGAQ
jgi:hypothetical protein